MSSKRVRLASTSPTPLLMDSEGVVFVAPWTKKGKLSNARDEAVAAYTRASDSLAHIRSLRDEKQAEVERCGKELSLLSQQLDEAEKIVAAARGSLSALTAACAGAAPGKKRPLALCS